MQKKRTRPRADNRSKPLAVTLRLTLGSWVKATSCFNAACAPLVLSCTAEDPPRMCRWPVGALASRALSPWSAASAKTASCRTSHQCGTRLRCKTGQNTYRRCQQFLADGVKFSVCEDGLRGHLMARLADTMLTPRSRFCVTVTCLASITGLECLACFSAASRALGAPASNLLLRAPA